MRNLSAAELLAAWERSLGQSVARQALEILSAAFPDCSLEQLAEWSVGRRDACLLALRERLFGSRLEGVSVCPHCGRRVELSFQTADIRVDPVDDWRAGTSGRLTLKTDGYRVEFRLLNSSDLLAIEGGSDIAEARRNLLARCVHSAVHGGPDDQGVEPIEDAGQLPETVVAAVARRMSEADPQADTQLSLTCLDCGHQWLSTFDIAAYLAKEIRNWARHVLREVHDLASGYGWSEAEILSMSPTRRRAYLEMLGTG